MRRKTSNYFKTMPGDPEPLVIRVEKRVSFSDIDIMGIVWHGRYAKYFEEGASAAGRQYGMSYKDFYEAGLRAPIVQLHVDYHLPLNLDEVCTIEARMIWNEGARVNIEYKIIKENGKIAGTGYTAQMFIDAETQEPLMVSPDLLINCRDKWKKGKFSC